MNFILKNALAKEKIRQQENIELIASENYVSKDILALQGSILTNKYAEGYPKKRYYGGCENIDVFEETALKFVKKLFNCKYANVQPHSGSSANLAVYKSLLQIKDKVMGLELSQGGHLTHGHPMNFSGKEYEIISYNVNIKTGLIDYKELEKKALLEKPKMIIAGGSAYARMIDFPKFRKICDEIGAILMVDMAHIAGLVAAGVHPSPFPYADIVTSTTHKTLRGPRGGIILTNNEEIAKKIDKTIFPGIQGGPLMHVIGAKAQCFYEALQPNFIDYQTQVIQNAKTLANEFKNKKVKVISGGTDNHLLLIDVVSSFQITGKEAEAALDKIHITVNKNSIPHDEENITKTSGIRIGTPAVTTRGMKEYEMKLIANIIVKCLNNIDDLEIQKKLEREVLEITSKYPIPSLELEYC